MLQLMKFQQPPALAVAPTPLPQRRECLVQQREQQGIFCDSPKDSNETITRSDLPSNHKKSSTDAPSPTPAASLEDRNSNAMKLSTSSSSSSSLVLSQDDAHLRNQLAEYQRHQYRYYKNLMRRQDEFMYDRACSSSSSSSASISNKDYFSSSTSMNQFKNRPCYNNGARPEDRKTFETTSYPSSFRNIRHDDYGADEDLLDHHFLHRHHAAEIWAKRDPHLTTTTSSVNATTMMTPATHPYHMMQTHSRLMPTSRLLPTCHLSENRRQVDLETHLSRFNTLNLSPLNIHANPNPGVSYSQMDRNRPFSFDGETMNQYPISKKELKVCPDSQIYHDQHPSSSCREQPFDLPSNNNSHTVSAEISHSSERTQHKTFSLQKIYQALHRHVRGSNQDDYATSKKNFLEGIRREGYISADINRSNIKPNSRKRSSEESIEPTEYSSMTGSSSIQQQSSYRERNVPTDILHAGSSYSFGQESNHAGLYSFYAGVISKEDYISTTSGSNHHNHPLLNPQYREPVMLGMSTDADYISAFLQFLRAECCQVFTAGQDEVNERKKSKRVVMHQVGIRCAFCAHKPYRERASRSSCYPSSLDRIYQSIVMMVRDHFSVCPDFPPEVRKIYVSIKSCRRRRDVDSRQYWAISARSLGISETDQGLFYLKM